MANKHISRKELLELLIDQEKTIKLLRETVAEQEKQLEDRRIRIADAGTVAEACLRLNRVYESTDAAMKQYMENIEAAAAETESERERILADAGRQAQEILETAKANYLKAKLAADKYVRDAEKKVKAYYDAHPEYAASVRQEDVPKK